MFKVGLGAAGYWWGISMCICFQVCFLVVIVGRFDWKNECKKVRIKSNTKTQFITSKLSNLSNLISKSMDIRLD